jgi:hypothetical protein
LTILAGEKQAISNQDGRDWLIVTVMIRRAGDSTVVTDEVSGATASGPDLAAALAALAGGIEARHRELEAAKPLRWPHERRDLARLRGYFGDPP